MASELAQRNGPRVGPSGRNKVDRRIGDPFPSGGLAFDTWDMKPRGTRRVRRPFQQIFDFRTRCSSAVKHLHCFAKQAATLAVDVARSSTVK